MVPFPNRLVLDAALVTAAALPLWVEAAGTGDLATGAISQSQLFRHWLDTRETSSIVNPPLGPTPVVPVLAEVAPGGREQARVRFAGAAPLIPRSITGCLPYRRSDALGVRCRFKFSAWFEPRP